MNRRKFNTRALVTVATALTGGCKPLTTPSPIVTTQTGKLQGQIVDGVHRFLGIPYAEPPSGERRWLAPVRRSAWNTVLPATSYGRICPQTGGGVRLTGPDEGEDCLNLNVWTPDPTAGGMPVMVWVHGGGQISGSGADNDGLQFAKEGVVLVTCNRRLGAEGFLYLEPHFGDNVGPGNLGIQDLVSVLEWVGENIRNFGGDPGNVTLFGASGGAVAAQAVIATPGSEGLVHRAILQSGGHVAQRPESAGAIAKHILDKFAIKPGDLDSLRRIPWPQFVDLYDELGTLGHAPEPATSVPVISRHMPIHPADAAVEGIGLDIDYLVGTCRDEANLFDAILPDMMHRLLAPRAQRIIEAAGLSWQDITAVYQAARPTLDLDEIRTTILGDLWFRVPSIRIAQGHANYANANTYMYLFEWASPFLGASHGLDMMMFGDQNLFLSAVAGLRDYDKTASYMRKAWTQFASVGNPTLPNIDWPPYGDQRETMSINETPAMLYNTFSRECNLLEPVLNANWRTSGL